MDTEQQIEGFLSKLKDIKKRVNAVRTKTGQVNQNTLRDDVKSISRYWFSAFRKTLVDVYKFRSNAVSIKKRDDAFTHLLQLSSVHGNKKEQYLKDLSTILSKIQPEIINPMHTGILPSEDAGGEKAFDELLQSVTNQEQNEYLSEAVGCAKQGYLKAAVVLGWCACVDHIHRKIDKIGYTQFNMTAARIASQKTGRFKRFNKTYNISSLGELREVFDKDTLIIIEGMGLIDPNQRTRLNSCLDMRNHGAHPGDAPITDYNVLSLFSDIIEIVLTNKTFNTDEGS